MTNSQPLSPAQGAQLFLRHRLGLLAFIRSCGFDSNDAEDILQEVFLAVHQSIASLSNAQDFLKWSLGIAKNRILAMRRQWKRVPILDPQVLTQLADASERLDRKHAAHLRRDALETCLDRLPANLRDMLEMRYSAPVGVAEIAAKFGRSVQGMYALLKRIRFDLRVCAEQALARESRA